MTDDLVGRQRRDGLKYQTDTFDEAAARIEALEAALGLALGYLIQSEPGDSRAVSDEFVAMAMVHEGISPEKALPIIKTAAAALTPEAPHAD